jgi:hypothetical protein
MPEKNSPKLTDTPCFMIFRDAMLKRYVGTLAVSILQIRATKPAHKTAVFLAYSHITNKSRIFCRQTGHFPRGTAYWRRSGHLAGFEEG